MRRGTFQWMKSVNKSIILNKIRTNEPISRAQIAKDTKITPPTVSSIVKELIEQEIVVESAVGDSKGGRKPTLLMINSRNFYIVGVDAGPKTVDCVLADLSGSIIERSSHQLELPITNNQFLNVLKSAIRTVIKSFHLDMEKIVGIGIAMHGVVNVETGTSIYAPNLNLSAIPIKEELEKEFGLIVKVENDARAMALGEAWFGNHGQTDSMLAVNLGRGVGAGIVINGKLYHGAFDIAGEIGHMMVDMNGEVCACGNRGCLQTLVSGPAIAHRAEKELGLDLGKIAGEDVFHLATEGNRAYVKILEDTGTYIGMGLTNLIHIVNPEKIVLSGGVTNAKQFILEPIRGAIAERALTPQAKQTEVVITELGKDATILGAVALLLVELFDLV
ncbi:ROK family transcriptional regulator [Virgibacillus oceani]|uniref:Xylose repressor n=1 Tax=Virgibacillus oceani TaxID=1479511 RepID=A0A917M3F7_9BACI|nr:ROK family transcriptional regulator [Virgibacillus oceani]GGG72721.1 xylose repressor [Virgibacillus oceani]